MRFKCLIVKRAQTSNSASAIVKKCACYMNPASDTVGRISFMTPVNSEYTYY